MARPCTAYIGMLVMCQLPVSSDFEYFESCGEETGIIFTFPLACQALTMDILGKQTVYITRLDVDIDFRDHQQRSRGNGCSYVRTHKHRCITYESNLWMTQSLACSEAKEPFCLRGKKNHTKIENDALVASCS